MGIRPFYDGRGFGPPGSSAPADAVWGVPRERHAVPRAWPPPAKFRAEIWGVGQVVVPYGRQLLLRCPKFFARMRSQNFDRCHSFLLASSATGGARKRPPLHKGALGDGDADRRNQHPKFWNKIWLAVATPQARRPVGPPRNDNGFLSFRGAERRGNPSFLRWTGVRAAESSAPTEGLPKSQQRADVGIGPYGKPDQPPKPAGAQRSVRARSREGWAGIGARTIPKGGPPPRPLRQRLAKRKARKEKLVKFDFCPRTSECSTAYYARESQQSPARAPVGAASTEQNSLEPHPAARQGA